MPRGLKLRVQPLGDPKSPTLPLQLALETAHVAPVALCTRALHGRVVVVADEACDAEADERRYAHVQQRDAPESNVAHLHKESKGAPDAHDELEPRADAEPPREAHVRHCGVDHTGPKVAKAHRIMVELISLHQCRACFGVHEAQAEVPCDGGDEQGEQPRTGEGAHPKHQEC